MSADKPRDFWIPKDILDPSYASNGMKDSLLVNVTEMSAYSELEAENRRLREAIEDLKKYWDISDPSCVQPAIETTIEATMSTPKIEIRNDSMAAGSLIRCIQALEKPESET